MSDRMAEQKRARLIAAQRATDEYHTTTDAQLREPLRHDPRWKAGRAAAIREIRAALNLAESLDRWTHEYGEEWVSVHYMRKALDEAESR